ncbi:MAG: ABC transporter permease, partial [Chloroflexi bacterium]|nr:ABC transporter permease [Chloroflexota bacterium]
MIKELPMGNAVSEPQEEEALYRLSQWQLIWRKFKKHKAAVVGGWVLIILYLLTIFAQFFSPVPIDERAEKGFQPPHKLHFVDDQGRFGLRPFVYELKQTRDPVTFESIWVEDTEKKMPLRFFYRGWEYKLWGLFPSNLHLFGSDEGWVHLFGTDKLGRDMFSRVLHGAQISLSIGLVGIVVSFVIGCILGGISGYFGGTPDM